MLSGYCPCLLLLLQLHRRRIQLLVQLLLRQRKPPLVQQCAGPLRGGGRGRFCRPLVPGGPQKEATAADADASASAGVRLLEVGLLI